MSKQRYRLSFWTPQGAWGFPWQWISGYRDTLGEDGEYVTEQSLVAIIAAPSEEEAWEYAAWVIGGEDKIVERRFCDILAPHDSLKSDRFPVKDWWPTPEVAWAHRVDEGWDPKFWEGKAA